MHNTHTDLLTQDSQPNARSFYTLRKRPSILQQLFNSWAYFSIVCLTLQIATGIRTTHAESSPPGSGVLMLHHPEGQIEAIQLDAHIDISVEGFLAEMSLIQTFKNTTDQWIEGSYLFPLPERSAIRGLTLKTGDRTIRGKVQTRSEAKRTYEDAKDAGQIAGLIEQQRPNLFTMKVASIAPGDLIEVKLDVMVPVGFDEGQFALTLPTTLTPRYSNASVADTTALHSPFNEPSQIRGPRLSVKARIAPIEDYSSVSSTTHTLSIETNSVELIDIAMDRDIELSWPAPPAAAAQSHAFVSQHNGQRYVQLFVNPPTTVHENERPARELILVIDKSGSMAGVSMDAAKEALHYAIDGLHRDDYINIIAFDDQHYPMFPSSLIASDQNKNRARQFIDQLYADGGTEMDSALSFALTPTLHTERLRQVVFLTDGSVAYEDSLLVQIKRKLGSSRLFTIGIGPAPNTWFLEKAAQAGRGISLSIQDSHDVAASITNLLSNLVHPIVTDMAIQYPSGSGELYPNPIPDLYANKPNMLVSRISDNVSQVVLTGKQGGKRWRQTIELPDFGIASRITNMENSDRAIESPFEQTVAPALAMHWAREKIATLMDEQRFAIDNDLHKNTITQLALDVGLVSRYTSFVAVDTTPAPLPKPKQMSVKVINLIPAGNQMMSVAMPQGAAGADTLALLSLLLCVMGIGFCKLASVNRS